MAVVEAELVPTRVGKVEVRRGGDGAAVVYLHSAQGEGAGLEFFDLLADRVALTAPMSPGFGESEGLDQIDDMEDVVFHLLDLFDELGLDAPTVAGLSLGGWMAAELAARYPERVGKLVLVNPAGLYIEGAEIADIFGRSPAELAGDLYYDQSHPMAQLMHAMSEFRADFSITPKVTFEMIAPIVQTMAATARLGWDPYLHNPKLRGRLWRVSTPTLVVHGAHDGLIPAAHAEAYAAEIEGASLVVMDKVAHMIPLEKPDELASVIADFALDGSG